MSVITDVVYGYGFNPCCSDEWLCDFILMHDKSVVLIERGAEILEYIRSNKHFLDGFKEKFFDYASMLSCDDGIYGIIADIMYKETGMRFEYHWDNDSESILLAERAPWLYNDTEMDLSYEKLNKICQKYMEELGIADDIECQTIVYYG